MMSGRERSISDYSNAAAWDPPPICITSTSFPHLSH